MISNEAVAAAKAAYLREFSHDENADYIAQLILNAAAPYLMAQAWVEGSNAQYSRVFSSAKELTNPYEATK